MLHPNLAQLSFAPVPSKSSLRSFLSLTAPPRAGGRSPPPFALILGMPHVPQSPDPGRGSPGGWERGSGAFDPPHISPAPCTAEPRHNCGRILPWGSWDGGGTGKRSHRSFSFPLWLLPVFSSWFGDPERGRGAGTCRARSLPLRPASCDTREHAPFPERKMT